MPIAITRDVSPSIIRCELTHLARQPIDVERARSQHRDYEACLAALGCQVRRLPDAPELPDAVFVEDLAVVLDELAIMTRPGAETRRAESASVERALAPLRPVTRIEAPGTLDGGDILRVGRTLYAGLSRRTNAAGVEQLARCVAPFGYQVRSIVVEKCLHLKSAVTQVADDLLLIQPAWVETRSFGRNRLIDVAEGEEEGANALLIGERVVYPSSFARTRERLEAHGVQVVAVDLSELARAEGGVTCCSLIVGA